MTDMCEKYMTDTTENWRSSLVSERVEVLLRGCKSKSLSFHQARKDAQLLSDFHNKT